MDQAVAITVQLADDPSGDALHAPPILMFRLDVTMGSVTMIATALSDETVVQVVDRRLTKGGVLYDDLANKAICGVAADASFSIAYTGLMMTPTRTDEWLANFLAADQVLALRLPEILEKLASARTLEFERLGHLPEDQRRLSLAFAGFCIHGPFAATVSNQEDDHRKILKEPNKHFGTSICLRNEKTGAIRYGLPRG